MDRPLGFHEVETPRVSRHLTNESGKVVRPMLEIFHTHFCYRLSAAGRITSMKNLNDPIRNPACITVP